MNFKKILIGTFCIACVSVGAFKFMSENIDVVPIHGNHAIYNNLHDLEEYSDSIIIGKMANNYKDCKSTVRYDPNGGIEDFYTTVDVKPIKIIKGNITGNTIPVIHSSALINNKLRISEDAELMKKGRKYVLFLKKAGGDSQYSIIAVNQGLHDIGKIDNEYDSTKVDFTPSTDDNYKNLKSTVINKYALKIFE